MALEVVGSSPIKRPSAASGEIQGPFILGCGEQGSFVLEQYLTGTPLFLRADSGAWVLAERFGRELFVLKLALRQTPKGPAGAGFLRSYATAGRTGAKRLCVCLTACPVLAMIGR